MTESAGSRVFVLSDFALRDVVSARIRVLFDS